MKKKKKKKKKMEYGRFEPSDSARFTEQLPPNKSSNNNKTLILSLLAAILFILVVVVVVVVVNHKHHSINTNSPPSSSSISLPTLSPSTNQNQTQHDPGSTAATNTSLFTRMCLGTQFPQTCLNTLISQAEQTGLSPNDADGYSEGQGVILQLSLDVTLGKLTKVSQYLEIQKRGLDEFKDSLEWAAHDDCRDLIQDSIHLLTRTLPRSSSSSSSSMDMDMDMDMMTWTTSTCSNHATCMEGFDQVLVNGIRGVKSETVQMLQDLHQIVSNHVGLSSMLLNQNPNNTKPNWIYNQNTQISISNETIQAHVTVSQDGVGPNLTVTTIGDAIKLVPSNNTTPFIIHVKAGRYQEEMLSVGKHKTNVWFIGDGIGNTIITGNKSCLSNNITTLKTASFGAVGSGFMARGITFENTAGPQNHQAVALLVKSENAVFYECEMKGYQDTLYVHSNRQFYRDCNIYGTVDFIFGDAQVVFQNCSIYALRPMTMQKNTITAQKKSCPGSISGISIHKSRVMAAPDLEGVKCEYPTYLGRPWRPLSTVVFINSYLGDHVDPQGWLPWNETSPLDSVFYGEFQNEGPGANTSQRIQSPGIHANLTVNEANRFTVDQFVRGSSWITPTRVPFDAGLGTPLFNVSIPI